MVRDVLGRLGAARARQATVPPLGRGLAPRGRAVDRSRTEPTSRSNPSRATPEFRSGASPSRRCFPWGRAHGSTSLFEPPPGRSFLLASLAALPEGSVVATGALKTGPISALMWTASVSSAAGYGTSVCAGSAPSSRPAAGHCPS